MRMIPIALLLTFTGCKAGTPRDQADAFADGKRSGQLDASLAATKKAAQDASDHSVFHWAGYDGTRICVTNEYRHPILFDETAKGELDELEKAIDKSQIVFGAYDSLSQVPAQWPPVPTNTAGTIDSHEKVNERYQDGDGGWHDSWYLDVVFKLCAPSPAIKASTRFITAMTFKGDGGGGKLFVWEIKGTPTAAPAGAGGGSSSIADASPATSPAATAPAPTTPTESARAGNIVEALNGQGGYSEFLAMVQCAGKEAELSNGQFTVLAFTDDTFRKKVKSDKARQKFKDACAETFAKHVAAGAMPASAFAVGAHVEVNTLNGSSHQMTVREGQRVIEAANGIIFVVNDVM